MRVDIDNRGIAELAKDPGLTNQMLDVAKTCAASAKISAPTESGTYKRSIFAAKLRTGNGAFFGSSDRKAMIMEYGSVHNKAFHTLRNAARKHKLAMAVTESAR